MPLTTLEFSCPARFNEIDLAVYQDLMATNAMGIFPAMQQEIRKMRRRARRD